MGIRFYVRPGAMGNPQGFPLDTLRSAFNTCQFEGDYKIQWAGSEPWDGDDIGYDDILELIAYWYDGGREHADEEICVLARARAPRHYEPVWVVIEAQSDSSGFGCRQSMSIAVAETEQDAVTMGMGKQYREDLGYE